MQFIFGFTLVLSTAIVIWLLTQSTPASERNAIQLSTRAQLSGRAENFNEDDVAQPEALAPRHVSTKQRRSFGEVVHPRSAWARTA